MRRILGSFIVLALMAGAAVMVVTAETKKEAVLVDPATAVYKPIVPGASRAVLTGDPDKGAYRALTKFDPGVTHKLHSHSNDLWMVVVKGAYVYKPENGAEKRVSAGQYLYIPAGDRHVSGSDAKEGTIFFDESSGKFDIVWVEEPAKK